MCELQQHVALQYFVSYSITQSVFIFLCRMFAQSVAQLKHRTGRSVAGLLVDLVQSGTN